MPKGHKLTVDQVAAISSISGKSEYERFLHQLYHQMAGVKAETEAKV